jgi:hypothetical protein
MSGANTGGSKIINKSGTFKKDIDTAYGKEL